MRNDMECPYCGADQEVCHDDGQGYEEDHLHEHQCSECEKNFVFTTSISYYYKPHKADCLNGKPHNLYKVETYTNAWPNWVRCHDCDFENRGEYKPKDIL